VREVAILADERPLIAAVYANRLEQGMDLFGRPDRDLRLEAAGPLGWQPVWHLSHA
jgi:hypothetical protein